MFSIWIKRLGLLTIILAIGAGGYLMIRPQPVSVDVVEIVRGDIETTVDEEGKTRVKDVYRISAPMTGKLERLSVKVGDYLAAGERIARIRSVDPPIRDLRTRRELAAATKAARAMVLLSGAEIAKANSSLSFARSDLERAKRLVKSKTITVRRLEQAELEVAVKEALVTEANANLELRRRQLESAQARQLQPIDLSTAVTEDQCCVALVTPVAGSVLQLFAESERVVLAGSHILDVGNIKDLEIVVDLLSADAVTITAGTQARIEDWGGKEILNARVRSVDPAGFTKISALGIEEQRVNVILDITDPKKAWEKLGHSYRVTVRVITSHKTDVLRIPISALFRVENNWASYVDENGTSTLKLLKLGNFSLTHAEVLSGLEQGEKVIVFPSDQITDGSMIEIRSK
ncbi:MAG: HlyD family efflux transporter periplasmic adaptor subunit [Rhizobiaceae bacterium]|nr:HlyD family efflux transporter periplasmic adaptor subunit [Rhizobiaceae bacterium]